MTRDGRTAGCSIRSQLRFVQLHQVLHLTARAIESVVAVRLRRAVGDVCDNEADIEPER